MNLLAKVKALFSAPVQPETPRLTPAEAAEGLRILDHAIAYCEEYGMDRNCEYSNARIILQGRVDAVWADFDLQRVGSVPRVA